MAQEEVPMILPKGIVHNTSDVYKLMASYPTIPREKIGECWKVYTTTCKKLSDPTARRLENFWWHVWGSDRGNLSGKTIARLFEDISVGPTFVPLRGPPNRFEGPLSPRNVRHGQSAPSIDRPKAEKLSPTQSGSGKFVEPPRKTSSSATRPPPPHPILKKARGPSASGPRPTARFVSPHESDAEDSKDSEGASSGSTAVNSGFETPGPGPLPAKDDKKKVVHKKKTPTFVASNATKRRPAMPRRQSSQSSTTGSEIGSKEGGSSAGSRFSNSGRPVSTIPERPEKQPTAGSQDGSSSSGQRERVSGRAAEKRPAERPTRTKLQMSSTGVSELSNTKATPVIAHASAPIVSETPPGMSSKGKAPVYEADRRQSEASNTLHRRSDAQEQRRSARSPTVEQSRPEMGSNRRSSRELSIGRAPAQRLISSSTATTSNVAAHGTIIEMDNNVVALPPLTPTREDEIPPSPVRSSTTTSLLDTRYTPTQPSDAPTVPLARTKSQLTLLLEREKARNPDKKSRGSH